MKFTTFTGDGVCERIRGARLLLTEDLNPGFRWRGLKVVNPLVAPEDPLLQQLVMTSS